MNFLRLDVELEGADVEIDFVIRIRRGPIDPARESGVLETLRQPRAKKRRKRLRPLSAGKRGERLRFADQNVIAVEVGRGRRLADPELRAHGVRRRRSRGGKIVKRRRRSAPASRKRERKNARGGEFQLTLGPAP